MQKFRLKTNYFSKLWETLPIIGYWTFQEIVLALIKEAMLKLVDKSPYFLIDGYPRELEQGTQFERDVSLILIPANLGVEIRFYMMRSKYLVFL